MSNTTVYPLQWPDNYKRTMYPWHSKFSTSFADARDGLIKELKLMGAKSTVLSTNVSLRQDGLPYANQAQPQDKGVAVYFTYEGIQVVLCCDKWRKVEDNIQAIRKTVNGLRMMPEWGVSDMLKRAFTGFKTLPDAPKTVAKTWWEILGVFQKSNKATILTAYRNLAKVQHPDAGGSHHQFTELNAAYQEGLRVAVN